jgi:hypothetical protein
MNNKCKVSSIDRTHQKENHSNSKANYKISLSLNTTVTILGWI